MPKPFTAAELKSMMARVLQEYISCGVIGEAFTRAGLRTKVHYEWLEKYPSYKEKFEEIKEKFVDSLESEAIRRAKEKSDTLLQMLLKAHRPEVYGDKSKIEMSGSVHAPIQLVFNENMLNADERKMIEGGDKNG
jgi:hypothetical protein